MSQLRPEIYLSTLKYVNADKEYWFSEFKRLRKLFPSIIQMANCIAPYDDQFKNGEAMSRLYSVNSSASSRQMAKDAVMAILHYIDSNPDVRRQYEAHPTKTLSLPC